MIPIDIASVENMIPTYFTSLRLVYCSINDKITQTVSNSVSGLIIYILHDSQVSQHSPAYISLTYHDQ